MLAVDAISVQSAVTRTNIVSHAALILPRYLSKPFQVSILNRVATEYTKWNKLIS